MNGERYSDLSVTAWKRCRGVREQKHLQSSVKGLPDWKSKVPGTGGVRLVMEPPRVGSEELVVPVSSQFSDVTLTAWKQLWREYLHQQNWPTLQISKASCETLTSRPLHIGVHRKAPRTTQKDFWFWKMSNTIKESMCLMILPCNKLLQHTLNKGNLFLRTLQTVRKRYGTMCWTRRRQWKLFRFGPRLWNKERGRQALSLSPVMSTTIVPDLQAGILLKFESLSLVSNSTSFY